VAHGLVSPNKGPSDLDDAAPVGELKISAGKGYTGLPFGNPPKPWRVDDEKGRLPHAGGLTPPRHQEYLPAQGRCPCRGAWRSTGIRGISSARRGIFPDLKFIVYHSAFHSLCRCLTRHGTSSAPPARELGHRPLRDPPAHPGLTNIYAELARRSAMVITSPMLCGHVLGMLVQTFGADHVLWGTTPSGGDLRSGRSRRSAASPCPSRS